MNLSRVFFLSFFTSCASLSALQESTLDPYRPLNCAFSSIQHNRIVFEGAGVVQIYSEQECLEVTPDSTSGQIFVRFLGGGETVGLMSFVLDTGEVQDVQYRFITKPSEVLVVNCQQLCMPCEGVEECALVADDPRSPEVIRAIIEGFQRGKLPEQCESVPHTSYQRHLKKGVDLVRVGKFLLSDQILYLYEIRNRRRRATSVSAEEMRHEGGIWSFVESSRIAARSKVLALVSVERKA